MGRGVTSGFRGCGQIPPSESSNEPASYNSQPLASSQKRRAKSTLLELSANTPIQQLFDKQQALLKLRAFPGETLLCNSGSAETHRIMWFRTMRAYTRFHPRAHDLVMTAPHTTANPQRLTALPMLLLASSAALYTKAKCESLHEIVQHHHEGKDDSWPWVWCQRNADGPLFVFSGVNVKVLEQCNSISQASPNHNILVIATEEQWQESKLSKEDFYKARCAVIESPIAQLDPKHKILSLEDERVIEFDHLYVS